jgi:hypothetical protein
MVPAAGLEPARAEAPRILSPLCLPFHHAGNVKTNIANIWINFKGFFNILVKFFKNIQKTVLECYTK